MKKTNAYIPKASYSCVPLLCRATPIPTKTFSAAEIAQGRIVTVAVQEMNFIRPVKVGNVVCCYGHCVRVGNTSLQLKIEVWVKTLMNDHVTEERHLVTEAVFTYVAIDAEGNPRPIPKDGNPKLTGLI